MSEQTRGSQFRGQIRGGGGQKFGVRESLPHADNMSDGERNKGYKKERGVCFSTVTKIVFLCRGPCIWTGGGGGLGVPRVLGGKKGSKTCRPLDF